MQREFKHHSIILLKNVYSKITCISSAIFLSIKLSIRWQLWNSTCKNKRYEHALNMQYQKKNCDVDNYTDLKLYIYVYT